MSVQPIAGGQMTHGLRHEPGVGVDDGSSGPRVLDARGLEPGEQLERISADDIDERREVDQHDRQTDDDEGCDVWLGLGPSPGLGTGWCWCWCWCWCWSWRWRGVVHGLDGYHGDP
jgi:hypothetical protein